MEMAICAPRVLKRTQVVFVVVVHAGVFEVDDADHLPFVDEWDGEFGAGLGVLEHVT